VWSREAGSGKETSYREAGEWETGGLGVNRRGDGSPVTGAQI
jgi:hypothetical protein